MITPRRAVRFFSEDHPMVTSIAIVIVAFCISLGYTEHRFDQDIDRIEAQSKRIEEEAKIDAQRAVDSDYRTCLSNNLVRTQLQRFLERQQAMGNANYSKVPGYEDLPPSFKRFLDGLGAVQRAGGPNDIVDAFLQDVSPRPCEELYPTHSPNLVLPGTQP